jgi:hypothetical protein
MSTVEVLVDVVLEIAASLAGFLIREGSGVVHDERVLLEIVLARRKARDRTLTHSFHELSHLRGGLREIIPAAQIVLVTLRRSDLARKGFLALFTLQPGVASTVSHRWLSPIQSSRWAFWSP